jgi:hypothetical protein
MLTLAWCLAVSVAACHRGATSGVGGGGDVGTTVSSAPQDAAAAAAPVDAFRRPGPRSAQTIFSPLDLPTPGRVRAASGLPGPDYWQQRADYRIEATLDADAHTIDARARITYSNYSPEPLPFLWIHLEQNAFTSSSINAHVAGPEDRFGPRGQFNGGIALRSVRLALWPDERGEARPIGRPGPGVIDLPVHVYDTVARLDLPQPMPAAAGNEPSTIQLEVEWSFRIPPYGADRMGLFESADGTVFQVAQWFPAMAVFDDVHGWNTLPYVGQGEFYTNFGSFDVSLTVPRDHLVAATGVLQNPEEVLTPTQVERLRRAGRSRETVVIRAADEVADPTTRPAGGPTFTWRFRADDARTFAWASSRAFIWDAAACEVPALPPAAPVDGAAGPGATRRVLAMSVYPREALPLWSAATEMLQWSIEHYSRRWYPYPYPVATNVNGVVGGMEYPMLVFCAERDDERGLFGVTTHEIGHNWFPMLVNTDERRHAWMDEGFNTFINYYAMRERYGDDEDRRGDARAFVDAMREEHQQPMDIPADQVRPGALGTLQYAKPATALVLLREQVLGPARFDDAFRRYIAAWALKSPQPADFFRCIENAAGEDLAWFWRGWFLETGALDQAIDRVEFSEGGGEGGGSTMSVTLVNRGELVMPVVYRVTYDDGLTEDRRLPVQAWYSTNRWTATWDTAGRRPVEVCIDPDGVMPDIDESNNRWVAPRTPTPDPRPAPARQPAASRAR